VTLTYAEQDTSDELERLAACANNGWPVAGQAYILCAIRIGEFEAAWEDFCEAVRNRDEVAPPATRHWTEVLGEDVASSQEQAYELLCERADEALLVLRTGIRK
jgi:hypothetical protein